MASIPTPQAAAPPSPERLPALALVTLLALTVLALLVAVALNAVRHGQTSSRRAPLDGLDASAAPAGGGLLDTLRQARQVTAAWDTQVADLSPLSTTLRPVLQGWLARWLQQGSSQVVVGREGWLYFRPALEHLTGPPFLSPPALAGAAGAPRHRDPRPAILDFAAQLEERGIALVLVPVPVKAAIEPERLAWRSTAEAVPLTNPSLAPLRQELERAGVLLFDPAPVLADRKRRTGRPVYLATDTHWRPEAAEEVAKALAGFIRERVALPDRPDPGFQLEAADLTGTGDLVGMLGLPPDAAGFPREKVTLHRVIDPDDRLWRLDPGADVLVLGDSFANVYSVGALGWGEAAGLCEHLSAALRRPVDAITRNDSGAWATRALLARELGAGRDRLAGKRVVVWELAARELSSGDWRPVALTVGTGHQRGFFVPARGATVTAEGVITSMGVVPQPRSAPYADYVVALRLADLESAEAGVTGRGAVVFVIAMRDYSLTPAASWRVGQRVALRLRPWADVADRYGVFTRGELADDSLMLVEPCFGEEVSR